MAGRDGDGKVLLGSVQRLGVDEHAGVTRALLNRCEKALDQELQAITGDGSKRGFLSTPPINKSLYYQF